MIDIEWPFATHLDYDGQQRAERFFQVIVSLAGIMGFMGGYIMQQFSITVYSVFIGVFIAACLILPPWSMFRHNPVQWQTTIETSNDSGKTAKRDVRSSKAKKEK